MAKQDEDNKRKGNRHELEAVEPRLLFSAGLEGVLAASQLEPAADQYQQTVIEQTFDQGGDASATAADAEVRTELIFVDSDVPEYQSLLNDLLTYPDESTRYQVFELDNAQDGLAQITAVLGGYDNVSAIHILSHGEAGAIDLGGTTLDSDTLAAHAEQVQSWGDAFTADADILIYGCNLAGSAEGQLLVNSLGALTGADVAASDDLTGNAQLGGDWDLEYRSGLVETAVFVSTDEQTDYQQVLATYTVTTTNDGGAGSLRQAIIDANANGGADTIVLGAGTYTLSLAGLYEEAAASGDLDITSEITIEGAGPGLTTISASGIGDRVFDIKAGGSLTLKDLTVADANIANQTGGAVSNAGTLNATNVVFRDNTVINSDGGALYNNGTMSLDRVSIVNNTSYNGGGIEQAGGTLDLVNVTVSGNTTQYDGAGIRITGGTVAIAFSTIAANSSSSGNGGGIQLTAGSGTISNSIVADNSSLYGGHDINGALTSGDYNIVEHSAGFTAAGNDQSGDPGLAALALDTDSGQHVHAITAASIACDGASGSGPVLDQRGYTRDTVMDIGAYEYNAAAPASNTAPTDIITDLEATTEDVVNSYTTGDQSMPAIAAFDDGGYIVVWESDGQDGSGDGIYAQIFNADGSVRVAEFLVNSETIDGEGQPTVATFADGGFVIGWRDVVAGSHAWTEARVFNADGTPATGDIVLKTGVVDGTNEAYNPAIVVLDNNRFVAVWNGENASVKTMEGAIFDRSGNNLSGIFTVGTLQGNYGQWGGQPEIIALSGGGFAVSWLDDDASGTNPVSRLRFFDFNGNPVSSEIVLGGDGQTDLARLADGNVVVVYGDGGNISAQIVSATGSSLVTEFRVNSVIAGVNTQPAVTALQSGGFYVAWQNDAADSDGSGIYGRIFDASGNALISETLLNQTETGNQTLVELATLASGTVRAVWSSTGQDGSGETVVSRQIQTGGFVYENAANGSLVTTVFGVDPEREVLIDALLSANPNLVYNVRTGKFYELVDTPSDWSTALGAATSAQLNGVSGQLVTVLSEYENQQLYNLVHSLTNDLWLGASDATTSDNWYWLDGSTESENFWIGDETGSPQSGYYTNWASGEPNNWLGNESYAEMNHVTGEWVDTASNKLNAYIIEYDASAVLGNLSYSLIDDAGGIFSIDSASGVVTLANSTLLDYESNASHSITVRVTDSGGLSYDEAFTINVLNVNEPPVVDLNGSDGGGTGYAATYTEDGGAISIVDVDATVTDVDNTTYQQLGISLNSFTDGAAERVSVAGQVFTFGVGSIVVSTIGSTDFNIYFDGSGFTITRAITGDMPAGDLQTLLRGITYENTSQAPTQGDRSFEIAVVDAGGLSSNVATGTITVVGLNDDPFNAGSMPTDVNVTEDVASAVDLSLIDVGDVDDAGGYLSVRLTTSTGGIISVSSGAGIIIGNNNSSNVTLNGTKADLNAYLNNAANIQYLNGTANTAGDNADTIAIAISDLGNSGVGGGGFISIGTVNVDIANVNDAPVIVSGGGGATAIVNTDENTAVVTTVAATDVDAGDTLTYSIGGGADAARFSINGSTGELTFIAAPDYEAPTDANADNVYEVTVQVNDGNGGADTQAISVSILNVGAATAVDDSFSGNEDTTITGNVLANDPSSDGGTLAASLVSDVSNGSLTLNPDGSFSYTPDANWHGTDSFQYLAVDSSTGPSHYWGLEGDGVDAVGSANGIVMNGPATVAGYDGNTLQFDGVNDHVQLTDISYASEFSLSFFFRIDDNTGSSLQYFYSHGAVGSTNVVHVSVAEAGYPTTAYQNNLITTILDSNDSTGANDQIYIDISSLIGDGQWHCYTATVTAGIGTQVYIDGTLLGSDTTGTGGVNPAGNAVIGARSDLDPSRFLNAGNRIDSVAIYDYALGAADISNLSTGTLQATATITVNPVNDAPTGSVVISGTPTEDQTLTASSTLADADGMGTVSYQWYRDGVAIAGATGSTYSIGDPDVGAALTVTASYTDGDGTNESVSSAATGPVASVNDIPAGNPVITGAAQEDQTLTADTSGISDADGLGTLNYQWYRDGVAIAGATAGTYTLGDADVGSDITVQVGYTDGQGYSESLTSAAVGAIASVNDTPVGLPVITGAVQENQILTADTTGISDADGLGVFSYQWYRDGVVIGGATASTYTLGDADVGTSITVSVSYMDGQGYSESLTSAAAGPVANVNDTPTGSVTIDNLSPAQGGTLTASNTLSDADGLSGPISYQWYADGVAIGGATGATYTLTQGEVGAVITVVASYTDDQGTNEAVTSAGTAAVANVNDPVVGQPLITGTPTEDQVLTADTSGISDADGLGAFGYQWYRDGVAIGGATGSTYTPGDADVGANITVTVSYTDGYGNPESTTSNPVGPVANINDALTGSVTIDNPSPAQGDTLTASNTLADADGLSGPISYQWYADGVAIGGATGATYTLTQGEVGTVITVVASYTDDQGTAESVSSAGTAVVTNVNDPVVGQPVITGTPTEDQVLTADTSGISDADGLGAFGYQWYRDGVAIGGATGNTCALGDADVGANITVTVSYTDGYGNLESITSNPVGPVTNVNDAPVGVPTIAGTAQEDQTLTVDTSGISDADGLGAFSYQWYRDGVAIGGATGNTYTLGDADVGAQVTVEVSYTDGHGTAESITSVQTAAVANVNDAPAGLPTISGITTEDQTLVADTSGISDADGLGTFSFQWYRDGVAIAGATGSAYTLGDADVGSQVSVSVSYIDGHGAAEGPLASALTAIIANINDAPIGSVAIDNLSPAEGDTLTASNNLSDADGLSGPISYQWYADGVAIGGATGATYTLTQGEVGAVITVMASYTDDLGTAESVSSAGTAAVTNVNDPVVGQPVITGAATEDQALTADTSGISDADGLGALGYQWYRDGVAIGGATGSTYTPGDADVGANITVTVSYTDGYGNPESTTSNPVGPIANINDAPTGSVAIDNMSPAEGDTLTASNTLADADGLSGPISYQWYADGLVIAGATSSTYTLTQADVDAVITVVASYTDDLGAAESVSSAGTASVTNVNDPVVGQPLITGIPTEDQVLTTDTSGISDADGLGVFSYQWYRDGVAIGGATASNYTLGDADVGAAITVTVNYTDGYGNPESTASNPVGPVANINDALTGSVTIDNLSPAQGDTLTASNTLTDADGLSGPISYQWYADGVAIGGATGSTFILTQGQVGTVITVVASYTDDQGTNEFVSSAGTAAVTNVNDPVVGQPVITGTPTEDQVLTVDTSGISDADGLGAFGYQWCRDGVAIGGATASNYTLGDADVGAAITVTVNYTDGYGNPESTTSNPVGPVANVNDAPAGVPTITGTVQEDRTLTADTSGMSDADGLGAFSYQWYRDGVAIGGATGNTYTLGDADVGAQISVSVNYTDGQGTSEGPLHSAQTAAVLNVNDMPTGSVTIDNMSPAVGDVITASHTLADADGMGPVSYQWCRDGVAIAGANGSSYAVTRADEGAVITVVAGYTDGHGTAESVSSAGTAGIPAAIASDDEVPGQDVVQESVPAEPVLEPDSPAATSVATTVAPAAGQDEGAMAVTDAEVGYQVDPYQYHIDEMDLSDDGRTPDGIVRHTARAILQAGYKATGDMMQLFDLVRIKMNEVDDQSAGVFIKTVGGISLSLSAGVVTWVLRGGAVAASMLSSASILRGFDPLPVMDAKGRRDGRRTKDDDDENVDEMFEGDDGADRGDRVTQPPGEGK